jgi:hypothetical protein
LIKGKRQRDGSKGKKTSKNDIPEDENEDALSDRGGEKSDKGGSDSDPSEDNIDA